VVVFWADNHYIWCSGADWVDSDRSSGAYSE